MSSVLSPCAYCKSLVCDAGVPTSRGGGQHAHLRRRSLLAKLERARLFIYRSERDHWARVRYNRFAAAAFKAQQDNIHAQSEALRGVYVRPAHLPPQVSMSDNFQGGKSVASMLRMFGHS